MGKVKDYVILVEDLEKRVTELEKRVQSLEEKLRVEQVGSERLTEIKVVTKDVFCPYCQNINYSDANFCTTCGSRLKVKTTTK